MGRIEYQKFRNKLYTRCPYIQHSKAMVAGDFCKRRCHFYGGEAEGDSIICKQK